MSEHNKNKNQDHKSKQGKPGESGQKARAQQEQSKPASGPVKK